MYLIKSVILKILMKKLNVELKDKHVNEMPSVILLLS